MQEPLRGPSPPARTDLTVTSGGPSRVSSERREPVVWSHEREASPSLRRAVLLATRHVADQMDNGGRFRGRIEDGAGSEARLLLTLIALGLTEGERSERLVEQLTSSQRSGGGWACVSGEDADLSTSVLAYLAIKLNRGPEALPSLAASRSVIQSLGGLDAVSDEANAWLAWFGQAKPRSEQNGSVSDEPWHDALAIKDRPAVDTLHGVRELRANSADTPAADPSRGCTQLAGLLWRRLALESNGDAEAIAVVEQAIEKLIDDGQEDEPPLVSPHAQPVVDTAAALEMLGRSGRRDECGLPAKWLADRVEAICQSDDLLQTSATLRSLTAWRGGDSSSCGALPPRLQVFSGDDENEEVKGLANQNRLVASDENTDAAIDKLTVWLIQQQGQDGGWGADDTTALAIEALLMRGGLGDPSSGDPSSGDPSSGDASSGDLSNSVVSTEGAVSSGLACLVNRQQPDGSWLSSRATDDVYATSRAVLAMAAAGDPETVDVRDAMLAGVNWLLAAQSPAGGWGESRDAEERKTGAATTTAWALEALTAADQQHSAACGRAVDYLLRTQNATGGWHEQQSVLRSADGARFVNDLQPTVAAATALAGWATRSRRRPAAKKEKGLRVVGSDAAISNRRSPESADRGTLAKNTRPKLIVGSRPEIRLAAFSVDTAATPCG